MREKLHFDDSVFIFQVGRTKTVGKLKSGEILILLADQRQEIQQRYKAEVKALFGSFVQDEQKRESDVDISKDVWENVCCI